MLQQPGWTPGSRWKQRPPQTTFRHLLMKNYNGVHKSAHAHVVIYVPPRFLTNRRKERQKSSLFHYIIKIPGLLWSRMWQNEQSGVVFNDDASGQQWPHSSPPKDIRHHWISLHWTISSSVIPTISYYFTSRIYSMRHRKCSYEHAVIT